LPVTIYLLLNALSAPVSYIYAIMLEQSLHIETSLIQCTVANTMSTYFKSKKPYVSRCERTYCCNSPV